MWWEEGGGGGKWWEEVEGGGIVTRTGRGVPDGRSGGGASPACQRCSSARPGVGGILMNKIKVFSIHGKTLILLSPLSTFRGVSENVCSSTPSSGGKFGQIWDRYWKRFVWKKFPLGRI